FFERKARMKAARIVVTLAIGSCAGVIGYSAVVARADDSQKNQAAHSMKGDAKKANVPARKMGELLQRASPAAKEEFLGSLVVMDGKVASVSVGLLTRDLGKVKVDEILSAIYPATGKRPTISGSSTKGLCGNQYC